MRSGKNHAVMLAAASLAMSSGMGAEAVHHPTRIKMNDRSEDPKLRREPLVHYSGKVRPSPRFIGKAARQRHKHGKSHGKLSRRAWAKAMKRGRKNKRKR